MESIVGRSPTENKVPSKVRALRHYGATTTNLAIQPVKTAPCDRSIVSTRAGHQPSAISNDWGIHLTGAERRLGQCSSEAAETTRTPPSLQRPSPSRPRRQIRNSG